MHGKLELDLIWMKQKSMPVGKLGQPRMMTMVSLHVETCTLEPIEVGTAREQE